VLKTDAEKAVLSKIGLDYEVLNSGCCGVAGAFGFEKEHYDISIKCDERVLLPAVRKASDDTLIIADGFICREQIRQNTSRQALHLAQVIQMAMRQGPGKYTESFYTKRPQASAAEALSAAALGIGAVIGAGLLAWRLIRRGSG
jgi:hypothetical protein